MASNLEEFLAIKPQETIIETHNVTVMDGRKLDVDIKNISLEQLKRCKSLAMESYNNPNGGPAVAQIEEISFSQRVCAAGIVEPNLNNAKLRSKFKVHTSEDLVAKLFPMNTIIELGGKIVQLTNSLSEEDDLKVSIGTDPELIEEAKN